MPHIEGHKARTPAQTERAAQGAKDRAKLAREKKVRSKAARLKEKAFNQKEQLRVKAEAKLDTARATGNQRLNQAKVATKNLGDKAASQVRGLGARLGEAKKATTTRGAKILQGAKDKLSGTFRGQGGSATGRPGTFRGGPSATGTSRAAATGAFEKASKTAARRATLLRGATGVGLVGALGVEAATKSNEELRGQSGIAPVEPLIGTGPAVGPTGQSTGPQNLRSPIDPFLEAGRAGIGLVRGAFGFGDEEGRAKEVALRGGPPPAAPAERGLTAGGAPAPQFEEGLQQTVNTGVTDPAPVGVRRFNNADARAAGAGIDPGSRRGAASLAENQNVIGRLISKNQGERQAQGLRAAERQQLAQIDGRQSSSGLDQLGRQAAGGGIASAFGALALGGNQLRREAAERGRDFEREQTATDASNAIQNTLAGQSARFAALDQAAQKQVGDNLNRSSQTLSELRQNDPQGAEQFLDTQFSLAVSQPNNLEANIFAGAEAGRELRDAAGKGFFDALDPGTERGLIDFIASWGEGGQAEPLLLTSGPNEGLQVTINAQTGDIEMVSPDGSQRQSLDFIGDVSPRLREFLKAKAFQTNQGQLSRQPGDPNRAGLRSVQLRQ